MVLYRIFCFEPSRIFCSIYMSHRIFTTTTFSQPHLNHQISQGFKKSSTTLEEDNDRDSVILINHGN